MIRDRMFVPVFFFGLLGTLVEPRMVATPVFGLAIVAAVVMFLARRLVFGRAFAPLF